MDEGKITALAEAAWDEYHAFCLTQGLPAEADIVLENVLYAVTQSLTINANLHGVDDRLMVPLIERAMKQFEVMLPAQRIVVEELAAEER